MSPKATKCRSEPSYAITSGGHVVELTVTRGKLRPLHRDFNRGERIEWAWWKGEKFWERWEEGDG